MSVVGREEILLPDARYRCDLPTLRVPAIMISCHVYVQALTRLGAYIRMMYVYTSTFQFISTAKYSAPARVIVAIQVSAGGLLTRSDRLGGGG